MKIDAPAAFRRAAARITFALGSVGLTISAAASMLPAAQAPEKYDLRHFTCPIGGKPFDQDVGYFSFPLLTLPDGSWLGDLQIDAQIPQCPDNGLVLLPDYAATVSQTQQHMVYHVYTAAEIARLPALIADPAYTALRADGRHAQAWWLATRLGLPAGERYEMLQRASWGAVTPAQRRRSVERLVADGPALLEAAGMPAEQRRRAQGRIVNALRELGRFDDALALLDRLEKTGEPLREPVNPDSMFGPDPLAPKLRLAIAEKDDGRFPIELLDRRMLTEICKDKPTPPYDQRTPANIAACKIRQDREAREAADSDAAIAESVTLGEKPKELASRCAATPVAQRGRGLAMACETLQDHLDEQAAAGLVKDGAKLAAACDATPQRDWKGPQRYGCISYQTALESALGTAIAADDAAWKILCPTGGTVEIPDRDARVSLACADAERQRADREKDKLLADPAALDRLCATRRNDLPAATYSACLDRDRQKEDAARTLLRTDDAVYARQCGRFLPGFVKEDSAPPSPASANPFDIPPEFADTGDKQHDKCRVAYDLRENRRITVEAEARGLACFPGEGHERPRCVTKAAYDAETAEQHDSPFGTSDDRFDENSSLSIAAREGAAAIIARAKTSGSYPKRNPGDLF